MNWFFCKCPVDRADVRFTSLLGALGIAHETTRSLNEYAHFVDAGLCAERPARLPLTGTFQHWHARTTPGRETIRGLPIVLWV